MRGHRFYNFPLFDSAAKWLAVAGYEPVNPAEIDRLNGFDPTALPADHDWSTLPEGLPISDLVRRDVDAILTCEAIYMLPGWESSVGAVAEYNIAKWLGLEIKGHLR
jgi:hypothetical protein